MHWRQRALARQRFRVVGGIPFSQCRRGFNRRRDMLEPRACGFRRPRCSGLIFFRNQIRAKVHRAQSDRTEKFEAMTDELAERLLVKVLAWGPEDGRENLPIIQALAMRKYDAYERFGHGRRFVESLALW